MREGSVAAVGIPSATTGTEDIIIVYETARRPDCLTGLTCVDGVCCASASCGTCQACNVSGSVGNCATVPNLACVPPG